MEPTLLRGAVVAVVWFLASIGIAISPDIPNSLIGVLAAFLAIGQALWTRPAVTPNAKVAVLDTNPLQLPDGTPGASNAQESNSTTGG